MAQVPSQSAGFSGFPAIGLSASEESRSFGDALPIRSAIVPQSFTNDGVQPQWWSTFASQPPSPTAHASAPLTGFQGVIATLVDGLNDTIGQIGTWVSHLFGEQNAEGPASQNVVNATFASTGDPHLSETGTVASPTGTTTSVNDRFDSMTSHDNLMSSQDFAGGYRVSTIVTAPNANGVTTNQSATVHTNFDEDQITVNQDGSYAIVDSGTPVTLQPGGSATLSGGEQVTRNTDGSLTVAQTSDSGGSIATTLRANGGGVDVTCTVANAAVGGDIADHAAGASSGSADGLMRVRKVA